MEDTPVFVVARLVERRNELPVSSNSGPECIVRDCLAGAKGKGHHGSFDLGEGLDGIRSHYAIRASSTAAESPEKVSVLLFVSGDESTICRDNVDAQDLCCS